MKLWEVAKASDEAKRNEQKFGLANNAFGAAAGAMGTKAVYDAGKKKHFPEAYAAQQARRAARAARRKPNVVRAAAKKVGQKIPAKVAGPAAVGGAVGMQVVNAGADAQSASYFARELAAGQSKKKKVEKMVDPRVAVPDRSRGSGHGRRIVEDAGVSKVDVPVSKARRRFDSEMDRQHRLGVYEGAGATGAAALAVPKVASRAKRFAEKDTKAKAAALKKIKARATGSTARRTALGAAAAGTAVAARRAYQQDRNQPWT